MVDLQIFLALKSDAENLQRNENQKDAESSAKKRRLLMQICMNLMVFSSRIAIASTKKI